MSTAPFESTANHAGPWIPQWTLADRLRKARASTGLTQREFASRLEVGAPAYSQWEADNTRPRDVVGLARRIELLTRIPAAWLLGVDESSPRRDDPAGAMLPRLDSNQQPSGYAETAAPVISLDDHRREPVELLRGA